MPGSFTQLVARNLSKVHKAFPKNTQPLICEKCEKRGSYDLGHITINVSDYKKGQTNDIDKYIQSTGYFRCKHCNSAGEWKITSEYSMMAISALFTLNSSIEHPLFTLGQNKLFDGSSHIYSTDAEEHILNKIFNDGEDSFLWNRLANLYYQGGRPDLAVTAYEQSLSIDPFQTESLYSLGMIIEQIEPKQTADFYHKVLITASRYTKMDAPSLRNLLSISLRNLIYLNSISDGEISIFPLQEVYKELSIEIPNREDSQLKVFEGDIDTEDLESLYPMAELFMGKRRNELPRKRTYVGQRKNKPKQKKKQKRNKK